jgi:hypothetical protein
MQLNGVGTNNTAVGSRSLFSNSIGNGNTGIGRESLFNNNSNGNTGIGYLSGQNITTGGFNTIIGSGNASNAGTAGGLTTGVDNIAIGSLFGTLGGNPNPIGAASQNILMGNGSAFKLTGNLNTIIGTFSGAITGGNNNVILGSYSYSPSTGNNWAGPDAFAVSNNTILGSDYNKNASAQVAIGDGNVAVGYNINQRVVGITNAVALGAKSSNSKSNQVQIGNTAIEDVRTFGYYTFQKQWDSSAVANQSLFVNSADGKLSFKDSSGNVFPLY